MANVFVEQPRLTIGILVLQSEGLVCAIRYLGFLFQTTPAGVFAIPQQIAVLSGHLSRDADLVAVEVVGLLAAFSVFVGPVMYLCQGFVRTAHPTSGLEVSWGLRLAFKFYKNNIMYQEMALIVLALKLVVRLFFL